jgi:CheY-like chemotaxis protein
MTMRAGEQAHLLLVEDSPTDVMFVREALAGLEAAVRLHVVEESRDALAFLRREPPHTAAARPGAILLDLNMPARNGHELLADIKSDRELSAIPVIVFTTSEAEPDIEAAYRGGANCFVTKPRDFHAFERAVRSITAFWLGVGRCL